MRFKFSLVTLVLLLFVCVKDGFCAVRYEKYSGGAINVNVTAGRTTEVVFPELIAQLLRSQVPGSIDLEVKDKSLYILPKAQSKADIFVRTVSNIEIPINIVFSEKHDIRVQVSYSFDNVQKNKSSGQPFNKAITLMKALIKGEDIIGATRYDVNEVVLRNKYFKATLITKYELNNSVAMVLEIENLMNRSIITPVQHVHLKDMLAITSDLDILAPNGQADSKTNMYLILRR